MGLTVGAALAVDKFMDVIDIAVTLTFSGNAVQTGRNEIDMVVASLLRLMIFVPTSAAGIFLWLQVKRYKVVNTRTQGGTVEVIASSKDVTIGDLDKFLADWKLQCGRTERSMDTSSAHVRESEEARDCET